MTALYYIPSKIREDLKYEVLNQAIINTTGPVALYETWPDRGSDFTINDKKETTWPKFHHLVLQDETRRNLFLKDYQKRASRALTMEAHVSIGWLGTCDVIYPLHHQSGISVIFIGGQFLFDDQMAEARERLERFLTTVESKQRPSYRHFWHELPRLSKTDVSKIMKEFELAGRSYLLALRQHSDLRYITDMSTHDVVVTLQSLIAEIEILQIDLKEAFNIGKKWERRFESLLSMIESHNTYLESWLERRITFDEPQYTYDSIVELVKESADTFRPSAKARNIEIRADFEQINTVEGKQMIAVRMQKPSLRQAFNNIFDNAVKYSFSGTANHPRWIDIVGRLETINEQNGYSITVTSLGVGIDSDEQKLVFEAGYRGKHSLDEEFFGHGLGLYYARQVIEKHEGIISLQSKPQESRKYLTEIKCWFPIHALQNTKPGDR